MHRYEGIDRFAQGIAGLLLAMRGRPVIRYQRLSASAFELARGLHSLVYKQVRVRA